MPQDPLLSQLASRCRTFSAGSGISLTKIARACGMEPSNFINFINGKIGLSGAATIKLYQLLGMSKHEVEIKLGNIPTAQIAHFQQEGKLMKLDDGNWTPGQQGRDPADTGSIIDNDDDEGFLAGIAAIHQSIIDKIIARQIRAKVNKGPTEPVRTIKDNTDNRKAGPRSDLFNQK
jgi:hypothetical protein